MFVVHLTYLFIFLFSWHLVWSVVMRCTDIISSLERESVVCAARYKEMEWYPNLSVAFVLYCTSDQILLCFDTPWSLGARLFLAIIVWFSENATDDRDKNWLLNRVIICFGMWIFSSSFSFGIMCNIRIIKYFLRANFIFAWKRALWFWLGHVRLSVYSVVDMV